MVYSVHFGDNLYAVAWMNTKLFCRCTYMVAALGGHVNIKHLMLACALQPYKFLKPKIMQCLSKKLVGLILLSDNVTTKQKTNTEACNSSRSMTQP